MFLASLEVRNFRGIASGRLELDATTVLIGENACGRSSLLAALDVALTPAGNAPISLQAGDFHRPAAIPGDGREGTRIRLTFDEQRAGEWDALRSGPLGRLLPAGRGRARRLLLEINAAAPATGREAEVHWTVRAPDENVEPSQDDAGALAALREVNPLIWLQGGVLMRASPATRQMPAAGAESGSFAALAAEVESRLAALTSGTAADELGELKAGYAAARELLELGRAGSRDSGAQAEPWIAEWLGGRRQQRGQEFLPRHGTAAEQLAALILVAAIVRQRTAHGVAGTRPLLVIEDPEAHLHPMTLASVWSLLENAEAQRIIGTHSEALLAAAPLPIVRRLTRRDGRQRQWRIAHDSLAAEELRKLSYHVRARHGDALFARCWLLVEGETEFWVLPELARLCGFDFAREGVAVVEFAQCGVPPLLKLARELGIEWHMLAEGDRTGRQYAAEARPFADGDQLPGRITQLKEPDIEHCFWRHGYADIYLDVAGVRPSPEHRIPPRRVIARAVKRRSKPFLAFEVLAAAAREGSAGVPAPIERAIRTAVKLARRAP